MNQQVENYILQFPENIQEILKKNNFKNWGNDKLYTTE